MFSKIACKRDKGRKQPTLLTVAVASIMVCAGAPHASAVPYTYTFTTGSSITWEQCNINLCGAGPTDTISGSFTYDATTSTLSAVGVTLTGGGPEVGTYDLADNPEGPSRLVFFGPQGYISLDFVAALSGVSDILTNPVPAPIPPPSPPGTTQFQEFCGFCGSGGQVYEDTDSASVTAAAAVVPEPSTWAMMLLGFAGLGFAGYRASRKNIALAA
jgi:hypothetical protein